MVSAYAGSFSEEAATLEKARVELVLKAFGLQTWVGQVLDAH